MTFSPLRLGPGLVSMSPASISSWAMIATNRLMNANRKRHQNENSIITCWCLGGWYCMSTNFWGWLNFAAFEGTSQTARNNPVKILWGYGHAKTCTITEWDKLENGTPSLLSFTHWPPKRNCVVSFTITCSLIHENHRTTNLERGMVFTPVTSYANLQK